MSNVPGTTTAKVVVTVEGGKLSVASDTDGVIALMMLADAISSILRNTASEDKEQEFVEDVVEDEVKEEG